MTITFKNPFRRAEEKGLTIDRQAAVGGAPLDLSGLFGSEKANSAVASASRFIRFTLPEAPFVLYTEDDKGAPVKWTARSKGLPLQAKQALGVLRRPNAQYGGKLLMAAIAVAVAIDGNGYAKIVRSGYGTPSELWYFPPGAVEPMRDAKGYLAYYRVTTGLGVEKILPQDMIHVRNGIDDANPLLGISDLKSAAREVLGDNKAAEYIAALLINPSTGMLVSPPTGAAALDTTKLEKLIQFLKSRMSGSGRFGPMGFTTPLTMQEFGITPDKMPVKDTRQGAVERILATIGIDPMVIGLPSTNKTYSNLREARRGAYKSLLIPIQSLIADEFEASYLSQFVTLRDSWWCDFDTTEVQELQEDENERWDRLGAAYVNGGMMRGEYRAGIGLESVEGRDDVFYQEVAAGTQAAPLPRPEKGLKDRLKDRRRVFESLGIQGRLHPHRNARGAGHHRPAGRARGTPRLRAARRSQGAHRPYPDRELQERAGSVLPRCRPLPDHAGRFAGAQYPAVQPAELGRALRQGDQRATRSLEQPLRLPGAGTERQAVRHHLQWPGRQGRRRRSGRPQSDRQLVGRASASLADLSGSWPGTGWPWNGWPRNGGPGTGGGPVSCWSRPWRPSP